MTSDHRTIDARRTAGPADETGWARALRYVEALLVVAIASALSWALRDHLVATRLLLFWVSSAYAAWRGGLGPALFASALGVVIANYATTEPIGAFAPPTTPEVLSALVLLSVTGLLGATFDSLRRSRAEAMQTAVHLAVAGEQLKEQAVELEAQLEESQAMAEELEQANEQLGELSGENERARDQLEHAVERYRALVEASTVVVWTADPRGEIADMPALRELTGQTPEQVRGFGWLDAVHPAERENVRRGWAASIASGSLYEAEFRLRRRDGVYRWFHARAVPIRRGARIGEWVGVFDDTHDAHVDAERRAAVENALSVLGSSLDFQWTLAALTRLMVPALADYCSVDLVEPDGSVRRVSTSHADPDKETLLRDMWERYPFKPTDRVGVHEVIRTGVAQVSSVDPALVASFARDAEHAAMIAALDPRSYALLPMTARGHTFGVLSLVYSDSGRRYDDADLGAAQEIAARAATAIDNARLYVEAQTANRAKSEFLATMSHELRTPLNAIAGYTELLSMGVRGPINEDQLRDLSRIRQNQQHLLEIITDILNFSRIEAGRVRYVLVPVRVRELVARMEAMIEPQARARSIEYRCENVADGLAVVADREKLEQVLINLLGNAVKFTPSGGRITLSAAARENGRVALAVEDTGVGIEPAQLGSIFEPFVQLEPTLTRTTEGAGLGLAISRELTRGMGGELVVTSVPGKGSTFTVELPKATVELAGAAAGDELVR